MARWKPCFPHLDTGACKILDQASKVNSIYVLKLPDRLLKTQKTEVDSVPIYLQSGLCKVLKSLKGISPVYLKVYSLYVKSVPEYLHTGPGKPPKPPRLR